MKVLRSFQSSFKSNQRNTEEECQAGRSPHERRKPPSYSTAQALQWNTRITSAVHCQLSPGLQIHVDARFSGHELCLGFSLHQTRAEVFTDRNPYFIGKSSWMLSWSESRNTIERNRLLSSPFLLRIIIEYLYSPLIINGYPLSKIHTPEFLPRKTKIFTLLYF